MNLRCAICCLNAESPTGSVMDRTACSLWRSTYPRLQFIFSSRVFCRAASSSFVVFLFSPSRLRLCSLVPWILTPEVPRKKDAQEATGRVQKEESGGEGKPGGKEGMGKDKVEISRRHHSLPPRRLSVSPPSLWPYKTAFHPHSWRRRTVARPAENRAELSASRFARSHFNRIARTSEEKKKERKAREKTGRFFRPNPGPAGITLTRTGSTEALGGGLRPLNYRAELFLLSIYRSLPRARTCTKHRAGHYEWTWR